MQRTTAQSGRNVFEVEGTRRTVNQGNTVQQQTTGEQCRKNVFGTGFGRVMAIFVEGHQGCHRNTCSLQSDEEQQEMSGGNHEIHTQQRTECQQIELTLLDDGIRQLHPLMCHQEDNQCTYTEDGLHDALYRCIVIHAAESIDNRTGDDRNQRVYGKQHDGKYSVEPCVTILLVRVRTHEEVGNEEDDDDCYQRKLFFKNEKLGIIHVFKF